MMDYILIILINCRHDLSRRLYHIRPRHTAIMRLSDSKHTITEDCAKNMRDIHFPISKECDVIHAVHMEALKLPT